MIYPTEGDKVLLITLNSSQSPPFYEYHADYFAIDEVYCTANSSSPKYFQITTTLIDHVGDSEYQLHEVFKLEGFDDDGIELNRKNALFVLNPTPKLIEKVKMFILGDFTRKYNNGRRRFTTEP